MKTGIAFGDHIKTEKIKKRRYFDSPDVKMRDSFLMLLLFCAVGVLFVKLVTLQIFQGFYYRGLSDSNRIRTKIIHAPRGVVFDRNGIPLVFNLPGFRKVEKSATAEGKENSEQLTRDAALTLLARGDQNLEVDSLREYPYKDALAHVLGYVGQISEEQMKMPENASYGVNDFLGKSGIEKEYEQNLRGVNGKQLVEVDAMGKQIRTLGQTDPVPGQDITLTIDAPLQKAAYEAMKDVKRGAVVVSTPKGEILSLISKPSFDPNLFTLKSSYKVASESSYQKVADILLDETGQPLLNRAIGGQYPPASTFKLITAAAGLEDKIIDRNFQINDTGVVKVGEFSFSNWYYTGYGKTDGQVNVVKAIARSNDIFFYKLAEMVSVEKLSGMANRFGLGKALGIDLGGEADGTVPTADWKKEVIGEQWYLGDTYHYGIGQGYLLATPLQVNAWTTALANGGTLYQPHILKNDNFGIKARNIIQLSTIAVIRDGMIDSCRKDGVAWSFFDFKVKNAKLPIDGKDFLAAEEVASQSATASDSARVNQQMLKVTVACKTGTAQHGGEETLPHSWMTLYAPAYNPQIVVTVLAEESGEGSNIAGPISTKIVKSWFENQKN